MRAVLDTVKIMASRFRGRNMAEFESRRRSTGGTFLTEQQLAQLGGTRASDLFRSMARIDASDGSIAMRGGLRNRKTGDFRCSPAVYVDDRYMGGEATDDAGAVGPALAVATAGAVTLFDIDAWVRRDEIAGIEICSETTVPLQYQHGTTSDCGAIVIWTK